MTTSSAAFYLPEPTPPEPPSETGGETGLVYKDNHAAEASSRLLWQHEDSQRLHAMVAAFARPMQEREATAFDMQCAFDVDTARGAALDLVGQLVGVYRDGRSDVAYRAYIYARILANSSDGATETIYAILRRLLGDSPVAIVQGFHDGRPAHFDIEVFDTELRFPWDAAHLEPSDVVASSVADAVYLAISAGVSFELYYQYTDDAHAFWFASGDVEEDSTTQGLADDDQDGSLGGALIGVEARG